MNNTAKSEVLLTDQPSDQPSDMEELVVSYMMIRAQIEQLEKQKQALKGCIERQVIQPPKKACKLGIIRF